MSLTIVETGAALGAEIRGVDSSGDLEDAAFEAVRDAFDRYSVIVVRDCIRDDEAHLRFSARFGPLQRSKNLGRFSDRRYPEIFIVSNVREEGDYIGLHDAGVFWHTDGPFFEKPYGPSALRALEVPAENGRALGDTLFASTSAAYAALPAAQKERLDGLQAVHSVLRRYERTIAKGIADTPVPIETPGVETEAVHPVVRVHPNTGKKCLFVTEGYTTRILGMPEAESDELLNELTAHCVKPEFVYRHSWRVNDLVMWDNCSVQHKATFDYHPPQRRLMHRTTLVG